MDFYEQLNYFGIVPENGMVTFSDTQKLLTLLGEENVKRVQADAAIERYQLAHEIQQTLIRELGSTLDTVAALADENAEIDEVLHRCFSKIQELSNQVDDLNDVYTPKPLGGNNE